jgi:uroporphyrin-III C-methyltransferase/precorrin-2 dehydrogenase/sirohydrochlorin ferrochelatase
MYPVNLNVRGQRCLVVGGGWVALRKVEGLLAEGARLTVVAPEPVPPLAELAAKGEIELCRRTYAPGEAGGYALAFAATDDRQVNRQVHDDARGAGVWVNVADDPELCTFHLPSRVRRGALQIAIASAGEAPFVVRRLRQFLEHRFGPEWAEWVEAAARFRRAVRGRHLAPPEQERCFDRFFEATVDTARIKARVPTSAEEAAWLGAKSAEEPRVSETALPASAERGRWSGLVSLVGAGPGDPGLLTVRGRQRLLGADTVVYDRLAATSLPCDLHSRVELHCVGKEAGNHPVPQEEINALLVRLGRQGKRVVRLKGGDPYVFGRGGEEALALAAAGIPFEVVPGVTAAVAASAYAGIPITHRREAVRVTILTAHESAKEGGPQVRWDLLGQDPHSTIVGYMGVAALPRVVERLLAAGMSPETPAAMVERGTTSGQRVVRGTLASLPDAVAQSGLGPPALFVIGPSVRHADALDWFGSRPLFGQRILIVAPAGEIGEALEVAGAEVVEVPLPVAPAARVVVSALPLTGCVVRSAEEVAVLHEERDRPGWSPEVVAWCLDAGAASRAGELGWREVREVFGATSGAELAAAIEAAASRKPGPGR